MSELQPVYRAQPELPNAYEALLADKRSEATRRAYRTDLCDFFGGRPTVDLVAGFVTLPPAQMAVRLNAYKGAMLQQGLAEATINRRLAAVRSLLKFAYRLGYASTDGRNLVDGEKVRAYRDTRGVSLKTLRALVQAPGIDSVRGLRDTAILRLLCENALRRAELCALDLLDFLPSQQQLRVLGKGYGTQKLPLTLSTRCCDVIIAYLLGTHRQPDGAGPLFLNFDHRPGHSGQRLTPDGLYHVVQLYGRKVGEDNLTPHKLRHSAITVALDATNGDVRKVQRLSRHADLRTLAIYDDNRSDMQGEVTGLLSGLL